MKILGTRKIQKEGSTRVIPLPDKVLEELDIKDDENIIFIEHNNKVYIQSSVQEKSESEARMDRIADENDDVLRMLVDK